MTVDFSTFAAALTERIHFPMNGSWEHVISSESDSRWSNDLLGRVSILAGNAPILYASGEVGRSEEYKVEGELIVFTAASVIHAKFSAEPPENSFSPKLTATVVAYPRSAVTAVHVDQIRLSEAPYSLSKAVVTIQISGSGSVQLPLSAHPTLVNDADLIPFIPQILTGR